MQSAQHCSGAERRIFRSAWDKGMAGSWGPEISLT